MPRVQTTSTRRFIGTQPTGESYEAGFRGLSGEIRVAGKQLTLITLTLETDSLWSEDESLLEQLQGESFLAVQAHPTIVFRSTEIVEEEDEFIVAGELTMRGVKQAIRFPVSIDLANRGLALNTRFTVDRTKFGMDYSTIRSRNQPSKHSM